MHVISVVGARPQFIKLAPIDVALRAAGVKHTIVHTGQHYDPNLDAKIFHDLGIPEPHVNLAVGSGTHAQQTGHMMIGLEPIFESEKPDWVLVYGDTNSTIAAALAAVKIHIRVAHLEAGLRSGNRMMPEEHNRIATDHLSDILLAPTTVAMQHLDAEGLANHSVLVGDVMVDACLQAQARVEQHAPEMPAGFSQGEQYAVATIHRAENTSSAERIIEILEWMASLPFSVNLLAHPRLVSKCKEFGIELNAFNISVLEPLTYSQMVYAMTNAVGVITDSGGMQKEAFLVGTPCVTVRTETEWPETLVGDWNILNPELSVDVVEFIERARSADDSQPFGDGKAAERVAAELLRTPR